MEGHLQIIDGPDKGRVIPFADGQIIRIGRAVGLEVQLSDPYISRQHCQLEVKNGTITLADLGSSRGSVVNGVKIESKRTIAPGDCIVLGATTLRVEVLTSDADMTLMPLSASAAPVAAPRAADVAANQTLQDYPEEAGSLEGAVVAGYRLGKKQASGTTGIVYQASKNGEPPVALKVFFAEFSSDAEAKQRYLRAVRTMRNLRHPHLVSILDGGECGAFCWLAMELVVGESLAKVIQRIGIAGILDWRYGLRIGVHVARGLEFVQKQSILHRNIKPSNILVRTQDNVAKLGDVMLAKALQGDLVETVTTPGITVGDVEYSSPERILDQPVDGRSDLFELGATVYALLTGRPPFLGKTFVARTVDLQQPAPPKTVQLSIPDEFNALVMRLLAKEPADRFQSPTELLTALEQIARLEKVKT